jgi:hypothetical protein
LLFVALAAALVLTSVSTRRRAKRQTAFRRAPIAPVRAGPPPTETRYTRKGALLSTAEQSYFGVLEPIAHELGLYVACKTRLSDVIGVSRDADARIAMTNRISHQHLDFVLCERTTMAPLLAIELEDATSARTSSKDEWLASAGLPLLRVRLQRGYAVAEVRRAISEALADKRSNHNATSLLEPRDFARAA